MPNSVDLARQLYAALDEPDTGPFLALCAPEVTVEYPASGRLPYGGIWAGMDRVDEFLTAHETAEELLVFELTELSGDGDVVFVLGHFEGRARDTGRAWSTDFVHVLRFSDGLLIRWRSYFDTAAALDAHS
jgi:uncharacterized protein